MYNDGIEGLTLVCAPDVRFFGGIISVVRGILRDYDIDTKTYKDLNVEE